MRIYRTVPHRLRRIALTATEEMYETLALAGNSPEEIAAITGRSVKTVRVSLHQCREKRRDLENLAKVSGKPC